MKKVIFFASILTMVYACAPNANEEAARVAAAKQMVLDSINRAEVIAQQQKTIDSLERVSQRASMKKTNSESPEPMVGSVSKSKKKMNNTTKGALIGAGVGVVTGVATSKNKVQGGIIGGIIGGGVGAGAGAVIDKKKKNNSNK